MSDLTDRNELIDYFCKKECGFNPKDCALFPCYEIEIIKSAPSVQPEQKTCLGCIHENKGGWKIDICGGCVRNASDHYEGLRGDSDENSIQI